MVIKYMKRCLILLIIRKMQIKTIMRYHLAPFRMATIKKKIENNCGVGKDMDKLEPVCTVVGTLKRCNHYEKQYGSFSKIKNKITIWSCNSTLGHIHKRSESRYLNRNLYTHVHSSIIHNSQWMEATPVSINGWMDKQNVVYT